MTIIMKSEMLIKQNKSLWLKTNKSIQMCKKTKIVTL